MILLAIDFSINGAIARFENGVLDALIDVPSKALILKPARYQFKYKDKKIVIKSGPNKGERPRKLRSKEKKKTVIDFDELLEIISDNVPDLVVIEKVAFMRMNSGTLTKIGNHHFLLGALFASGVEYKEVAAITWKKALNVTSDKETSMRLAHKLFDGWKFGRDDEAEAALIGHWYLINNERGL